MNCFPELFLEMTTCVSVLPKYEAKLDVPANVLSTDPVKGTASAK